MKARFVLIILSMTLLSAVAGDDTHKPTLDKEKVAILSVANKYKPEGTTTVQVERVSGRDKAYVRYSVRRGGYDVVAAVVTLKKTSKKGWEVESCAR